MTDRRDHPVAVSADALAASWARTEDAPHGALVVVGQEISPRCRGGRLWTPDPEDTLALSLVVRPTLPQSDADILWLAAGQATVEAIDVVGGGRGTSKWPDLVVTDDGRTLAAVTVSTQLGPGGLRSAVITVRVDLAVAALTPGVRAELVEVLQERVLGRVADAEDDAAGLAGRCLGRSALSGKLAKVRLLPHGMARGRVQGFAPTGALLLGASAQISEAVPVDAVAAVDVVDDPAHE